MCTYIVLFAGVVTVGAWVYLLAGRGGFWRINRDTVVAAPSPSRSRLSGEGQLAVVIPARNEASVIAQAITALLQQANNTKIRIFLVDDNSTDGTADIANAAAKNTGRQNALTVIQGRPLPPGWSGKLWAVQQGLEKARELRPRFFLLTDADIVHTHQDLSALIEVAESGNYDLASLMVRLHCRSLPEKLLIPAFVFFFFKLYPPRWIADLRHNVAGAAGGCILICPEALERTGGIEAIRHEVIDDCALARAVKRSGGTAWLGLAESSASIRPYRSFAEIGRMISRTAFNQLRHSALRLSFAIFGLVLVYLLPLALAISAHPLPRALGLTAWGMMTITYWPMVRYYRLSPLWSLSLPIAALFYAGATIHSAVKYWLGTGGEWKGRVQDPATSSVAQP